MIRFHSEDISLPDFQHVRVISWINQVAALHGCVIGEIQYVLCSDQKILEYNNTWLKHDYYTDIITFDYSEKPYLSGDIYVGLETVCSNAVERSLDTQTELMRILIHGILHLIGFKDKTPEDEAIMHEQEDVALSYL